jgi:hypothetical protein
LSRSYERIVGAALRGRPFSVAQPFENN